MLTNVRVLKHYVLTKKEFSKTFFSPLYLHFIDKLSSLELEALSSPKLLSIFAPRYFGGATFFLSLVLFRSVIIIIIVNNAI